MGNGRHIGWGAVAFARQIRHFDHAATRIPVSMGAAVLVVTATVLLAPASTVSPALKLSADSTALILGRTSVPTPNDAYVEIVKNQYIGPTHPGQVINYVAVTTPQEFWPLTALLFRLPGLALGPRDIWGLGGPGWPNEPWWKLSGLFDLTIDQSLDAGVTDLEQAMAEHGNDNLVIYGYSQGAGVANIEKRKLAEQYPVGTTAPDIDFVLGGDPNLPNGGVASRFSGLYLPFLGWTFNGPAPTDTQFDTTVIVRQYDIEDFPLYPLNIVADLNALLGAVYVHFYGFDVSLAPDPSTSPSIQSQHGDTTYYFFPTADLPLFGPLRTLGVPEAVIDVVEPFFRVLVELGYDRSIPLWESTPARLFPTLDPGKVAADLVNAIGEGVNNAAALVGSPAPLSSPATPAVADPDAAMEHDVSASGHGEKVGGDSVSQVLTAVESPLPKPPASTQDDPQAIQHKVDRELAATRDQINETIGAVKSVSGDGRTIVSAAGNDNGSPAATTITAHNTPVRDAVKKASGDIKKA
jgi:PE-PPE domain